VHLGRSRRHPPPPELIPLTGKQVSHLFVGLTARPLGQLAHRLRWSLWRRRHQAHARTCQQGDQRCRVGIDPRTSAASTGRPRRRASGSTVSRQRTAGLLRIRVIR
jgi:hypothetical protein